MPIGSDMVELENASVSSETPKAYLVSCEVRTEHNPSTRAEVWFPKSQCELQPSGRLWVSTWIYDKVLAELRRSIPTLVEIKYRWIDQ